MRNKRLREQAQGKPCACFLRICRSPLALPKWEARVRIAPTDLQKPKPPLGDQGEVARRSRDGRDEKVYVLPHHRG